MLCAETEQGVAQAIIRSVIDFKRDPWPKVSDNAKDLVKKMLNPDPSKRLTAQQVLGKQIQVKNLWIILIFSHHKCINGTNNKNLWIYIYSNTDHPWLQNAKKAPNVSLGENVKTRLKQFSVMNKLKKRALRVFNSLCTLPFKNTSLLHPQFDLEVLLWCSYIVFFQRLWLSTCL